MAHTFGWLSVLPPALAIGIALTTKRVLPSLLAGVLSAAVLLNGDAPWRAPAYALDYLVTTLTHADNLRLVVFSMLVGGLLKLMKDSNAFEAFASALRRWRKSYGRGTVFGLTWLFGVLLILETWSNVLINGATLGTLYDKLNISRTRLAYFIHTIAINVVALVLINSWGAFYLALVSAQRVAEPLHFLVSAMPYALYCWISLIGVAIVMATGLSIGPMRAMENNAEKKSEPPLEVTTDTTPMEHASLPRVAAPPRLRHMLIPIVTLLGGVLLGLWITGGGNIIAGDGSSSILYAVVGAIFATTLTLRFDRLFTFDTLEKKVIDGSAGFLDVGLLIVLALALGALTKDLGTGRFVAQVLQTTLPHATIPALVFVLGAIMSFATGTSYGTFSIMVPIALPIGAATGVSQELLFGACIAGGVFGDNCSPISDTSIVTSVASGTSVIDHTRTQLPYALIAAAASVLGYLLLGWL